MDLVVAYFHPELGVLAINPEEQGPLGGRRRPEAQRADHRLRRHPGASGKDEVLAAGIATLIALVEGSRAKGTGGVPQGLATSRAKASRGFRARARERPGPGRPRAEGRASRRGARGGRGPGGRGPGCRGRRHRAPAAAPAAAGRRMTPMYSIPVTNELFHNGNVEAWKKIIQSYTTKYPGLEVYVFYEGERIHDINTLFKWGKVKHGSAILIAVAGADIRDVAKLQRYLKQGASQHVRGLPQGARQRRAQPVLGRGKVQA